MQELELSFNKDKIYQKLITQYNNGGSLKLN